MSVMVIVGDDDEIAKTSKCFDSDKADSDTVRCVKQRYRLHGRCQLYTLYLLVWSKLFSFWYKLCKVHREVVKSS